MIRVVILLYNVSVFFNLLKPERASRSGGEAERIEERTEAK